MSARRSKNTGAFPSARDMILAYRKVKAELWWMKTIPALNMLAEYENDLEVNLKKLRTRILSGSWDNLQDDEAFLGKVVQLPKKLDPKEESKKSSIHYIELSNKAEVKHRKAKHWMKLECRPMAIPSIDFQILGVLWTMGDGGDWDANRTASCRANILRRQYVPADEADFPDVESTLRGPVNKNYPGVFKPYFHAYKKWRNDGLKRAKNAIANGQRVFALTLDLRRYYHQIDATCVRSLRPAKKEDQVSQCFYSSLEAWQEKYGEVPDSGDDTRLKKLGIPVGLIASALVANLILQPLDEAIQKRLSPIYYGRYVDDLFLVLSLNGNFQDGQSVMMDLVSLMQKGEDGPVFRWNSSKNGNGEDTLQFCYEKGNNLWGNSIFECKAEKQRLFLLEGQQGADLLSAIDSDLMEHSSEWRMVPDLDEDDDRWLKETLIASQDAAEGATTLRRADGLSIKRLGVAVALRKLEAIERFQLKPEQWKTHRKGFYRIAQTHIFSAEGLCDYWPKLPALFGLVFANEDWKEANQFLTQLSDIHKSYQDLPTRPDHGCLVDWLILMLSDELKRSCKHIPKTTEAARFFKRFHKLFGQGLPAGGNLRVAINDFQMRDLDRGGYRMRARSGQELSQSFMSASECTLRFFSMPANHKLPDDSCHWLMFPTRPLGEMEVCLLHDEAARSSREMGRQMFAIRGMTYQEENIDLNSTKPKQKNNHQDESPQPSHINFAPEFPEKTVKVAISNYRTEEKCWTARVRGKPVLSVQRLSKLLGLVDDFLRATRKESWLEQPLYFCLPELSIPTEWLHEISGYFSKAGISLIAGAEYENGATESHVVNQAYLYLRNRNLGYPTTWVVRQKKTAPAPAESLELWHERELQLDGQSVKELPIYVHGDFRFGLMICSELTDAETHYHFRGYVDAIICLEWNRDIDTFSALVESTAQSIHCFIVQVNNRKYGDSRIRSPGKKRFDRDIARIHGGIHDCFVVGELPIKDLRNFQRKVHSDLGDAAKYKPLPSGYNPQKFTRLYPKRDEDA